MTLYVRFLPFLIALAITLGLVNVSQNIMPRIEGRLSPIATATNVRLEVIDAQKTLVRGVMDKRRDCPITDLKVYQVSPFGQIVAIVDVRTNVRLRDAGVNEWGPWEVSMPMWQAEANMRAVTTHQCHPFWPTETVFFDTSIKTCTVECREP